MDKDHTLSHNEQHQAGHGEVRDGYYIRSLRVNYQHIGCKGITTLPRNLAETYDKDPKSFTNLFCISCIAAFPLHEFVWLDTNEQIGT